MPIADSSQAYKCAISIVEGVSLDEFRQTSILEAEPKTPKAHLPG